MFLEPAVIFEIVAVAPSVWPVIVSLDVNALLFVVMKVIGFVGLITTAKQSLKEPLIISPLLNVPEIPVMFAWGKRGVVLVSSESRTA